MYTKRTLIIIFSLLLIVSVFSAYTLQSNNWNKEHKTRCINELSNKLNVIQGAEAGITQAQWGINCPFVLEGER